MNRGLERGRHTVWVSNISSVEGKIITTYVKPRGTPTVSNNLSPNFPSFPLLFAHNQC